jgi:penicillin-binding protein 1A
MRELNMIDEAAYDKAVNTPLKLKPRQFASGSRILNSPYFVNYVLTEIRERHPDIDVTSGGYRIETTLDTRMQDAAEGSVAAVVRKYRRRDITTAAFVCIDDEGRVKAMVGGVDYDRNQYNVVYQGRRQPGSAMKPFVYAAALSTGTLGFYESISNEPYYIETPSGKKRWPKGGGKGGSVSVTSALAMSINVPAVRVMEKVGPQTAVNYAKDVFGFQSKLDPVLALVLGSSAVSPLELAQGYSVFMLHGDRATPFGIKRIICPDGRIIDDFGPRIYRDLLDPRVCEFMDGALRKVVTSGTARKASSIPNARGKTGTTSDHRDAWFCGYTNNLVGIGWVANEQFEGGRSKYLPMDGVFGGQVTIEIWSQFMKRALRYFDDSKEHGGEIAPASPTVETDAVPVPEEVPVDESPGPVPDDSPGTSDPNETAPDGTTGNPDGAGEAVPSAPRTTPPTTSPQSSPATEPAATEATSSVEICVDSGLRATPYCPETVTRRVPKNAVPGRCKQHGPRVTLLSRLKSG